MKKAFFWVLILGIVFAVFVYRANSDIPSIITKLNLSVDKVKKGDLVYKIYLFNIIPMAEAIVKKEEMSDHAGKKAVHLEVEAATLENLSFLFEGKVKLDSYLDPKTRNPFYFRQELFTSNKGQEIKEVSYDHASGVMVLKGVRRIIFPDTQDFLSLVDKMKRFDFVKSPQCRFYINTNQKNYLFSGSGALKPVTIRGKVYDLLNVEAQIKRDDKNNPYHRTNLNVYMFKGVPVYMRVVASGILITARLEDIK